jgi:alkylation response protein AidB-like acyl-CoA dehydrogenase
MRPRDLLTDALLGRLEGTDGAEPATLARDLGRLRDAGYLSVTLPRELGGLGCTLRQAACGQRRLAAAAPRTALAVSAHLYWTGAAADAYRSGDASVTWILQEAGRGALFGGGHGDPGNDLKLAAPDSRCDRAGDGGYRFGDPATALASVTPDWDWLAVHALTRVSPARVTPRAAPPPGAAPWEPSGHQAVLAFAGRRARCHPDYRGHPDYRVVRVLPAGAPSDVFTTSAIGWGCSLLASVEFAAARQAFRQAVAVAEARAGGYSAQYSVQYSVQPPAGRSIHPRADTPSGPPGSSPLDRWPVAEASLRLDALKARIAEVTHPWPLVPEPCPDLGGQQLIATFAMRHEVAEGAVRVRALSAAITSAAGLLATDR